MVLNSIFKIIPQICDYVTVRNLSDAKLNFFCDLANSKTIIFLLLSPLSAERATFMQKGPEIKIGIWEFVKI